MKAAVIGSGAWGTALAIHLHQNGHEVTLWARSEARAAQMRADGVNPRLPGVRLPEQMRISADRRCAQECDLVVFAVPSATLRQISRDFAGSIGPQAVLVSVTKGLESGTHLRMSQIVEQETGREVVVLTGPSHAEEVSRQMPTGLLAAGRNRKQTEFVQNAFFSPKLRVYTSPDPVGAELGGALKNVIALCAGIADGMGCGDNAKAMLMTRGLTETARLGVALGASKETFAGLAGVGDLIVTCTSMHSRNRCAGILIGQGVPVQQAMEQIGAVVEGYYATYSAWELSRSMGVDMPIVEAAYQVLYENVPATTAVQQLLTRPGRDEQEDAGWL